MPLLLLILVHGSFGFTVRVTPILGRIIMLNGLCLCGEVLRECVEYAATHVTKLSELTRPIVAVAEVRFCVLRRSN